MRYRRAIQKLRILADACQESTRWPPEGPPLLVEAYVFGDLLTGPEEIDWIDLALVVSLPPDEVPWESRPAVTQWLVHDLRLDKGGFNFLWRSHDEPVWNHHIREPVRFWAVDGGTDDDVLRALAERRFGDLPKATASADEVRERTGTELATALARLREVRANYWEQDWRRAHRGNGRYPEHELWDAVEGYLDLLDATERPPR